MGEENGKKYHGTFKPSILCTNRIDIRTSFPSQCLTSRSHMPMISDKIEWGKFRVQTKDIIEISQFHRFIISKPQDKTEQTDQSSPNIGRKIYLPRIKTETYEEKWKLKKNPKLILWLVTALGETVEEQNKLHPAIQKMRHFCRDIIDAVDVSVGFG
ncbi:uncharacterized protein LOC131928222 [Physella acuta]|uniref:uncharacterized protein LOC131928222 n=1 Tax=Physella acuta TaxID=109671 RepID=UPI0027DE6519|nr:uncharacterized protein LOC131928222 [Physella acuta]